MAETQQPSVSTGSDKKKAVRFNPHLDVLMLREVLAVSPYSNKDEWATVSDNLNRAINRPGEMTTARTVRERAGLLIDRFKKDEMLSMRKSGTVEEYEEREVLLTEIVQLINEASQDKTTKKTSEKERMEADKEAGLMIRQEALQGLKNTNKENPRKRKGLMGEYLAVVVEKQKFKQQQKEDELNLRREELQLARDRFDLERQERLQRLPLDIAKEEMFLKLLKRFNEQ